MVAEELGCGVEEIADFELNVCDTQPSCIGGARKEFIFSGRLDNLASSYCALQALIDTCSDETALADETRIRAVACFDNEEVGHHILCKAEGVVSSHVLADNITASVAGGIRVRTGGRVAYHVPSHHTDYKIVGP